MSVPGLEADSYARCVSPVPSGQQEIPGHSHLGVLQWLCQLWGALALPSREKDESLNFYWRKGHTNQDRTRKTSKNVSTLYLPGRWGSKYIDGSHGSAGGDTWGVILSYYFAKFLLCCGNRTILKPYQLNCRLTFIYAEPRNTVRPHLPN